MYFDFAIGTDISFLISAHFRSLTFILYYFDVIKWKKIIQMYFLLIKGQIKIYYFSHFLYK